VVSQTALLELLIAEAGRHPGFRYRPGTGVRDVLRRDDRVAGVRVSRPQGEEEIAADLVVGCDGRSSLLRKRTGLGLQPLPESYDVLWFKLPRPKSLEGRHPVQIFASGADVVLAYASWDGRWQLAWMLPRGGWREARERDWLSECAALLPEPLAAHLLAERAALEGPVPLDVVVGRCPRWHRPGLLLLGDAAHPMSPVRAQGINMALRDALVAANHLVPALQGGADLAPALAAIQREREREIVPVQKLQSREVRGQRWARERPWLMKPLLALVPALMRSRALQGLIQRSWLRQQRPLRMGVTEVRLRI
jgi:2-polyprenyl-6-methoxyphenol hydroxylase-like FAD-dependent oxidoreductase